jgi:DNA-directed RNA polymerase subunit RPC12/RpoP
MPLNSLEWSKRYDVFSVSRLSLSALGFSYTQIKRLSDDDMQAIADQLREELENLVGDSLFDENVRFATNICLEEKGSKQRYKCSECGNTITYTELLHGAANYAEAECGHSHEAYGPVTKEEPSNG